MSSKVRVHCPVCGDERALHVGTHTGDDGREADLISCPCGPGDIHWHGPLMPVVMFDWKVNGLPPPSTIWTAVPADPLEERVAAWSAMPPPPVEHRCACGQAILASRSTCDRCQERTDEVAAVSAAITATTPPQYALSQDTWKLTEPEPPPFAVGDHVMWRVNPSEEQRHLVVQVAGAFVTIRPIGNDGTLLAAADWNIECPVDLPRVRKVDAIPTHEPTETRGRKRLKPGVTL